MRGIWKPLLCLVMGAVAVMSAISIGRARQGDLESGPFWADVIFLTMGGALLFVIGAIWLLLFLARKMRR